MNDERSEIRGFFNNFIVQIVLIVWGIGQLFPILFLLYSSLKTNGEILRNRLALPESLYFGNYDFSDVSFNVGIYFKNSLLITIIGLVLMIVLSYSAAYAIAKLPFKGKNIILVLLISLIGIPVNTLMIPIYYYIADMGLLNRYIGVILPYIAQFAPFQILLLQAYFREFPNELIEAARVDGCNNFTAFIRIVLPISLGAVSTVLIIGFINIWNEFLLAFILLKDKSSKTLTVGLREFFGEFSTDWGHLFAAMVVVILPTIIFYLVFHRNIIKGIGSGALKG